MASDTRSKSADESITLEDTQNGLSVILESLKNLEELIQNQPQILYWVEKAILEAEAQLVARQSAPTSPRS